jgi:ABC-type bacteriocin/lantibiotic exporter with double-glycine peptidase domain
LARALIKNPSVVILDEGTANLDPENEKAIIQDLKQICKGRTCILVTHKIDNYLPIIDLVINLDDL